MPAFVPVRLLKFSTFVALLLLSAPTTARAAETTDPYAIPEGVENLEQFMEFVQEVSSQAPQDAEPSEAMAHHGKVARTVVAGAEKLLAKDLGDDEATQCVYLQLQGLSVLRHLGAPEAAETLSQGIERALADKRSDVQAVGAKFKIETGFAQWKTWDDAKKENLVDWIAEHVTSQEPEESRVSMVATVVDFLGSSNSEKLAVGLLEETIAHFQTSSTAEIQEALISLQGIQRRMNLPGNSIELSGQLLDGSELDWASYRGKVVLVDYWATWCGPCREEIPNVLEAYRGYHDKGFEVLGISLDESPKQAKAYIETSKIPWATLFSKKKSERGWEHPMVVHYGISGIPQAILVDQEGKVVNLSARGPVLMRELQRLLGDPIAQAETDSNSK